MNDIVTPQFALPFRLGDDDQPLEVEQDSAEEVASCVETLMRTPIGFLEEEPDYGIIDPTFEEGAVDIVELQSAISQWEERADALIDEQPDFLDQLARRVTINVQVRSE